MRTTTTSRRARTALVIGSALAAPAAFASVASAVSPDGPAPAAPSAARASGEAGLVPAPLEVDVDATQAFWDAGYQYCDAEALADAHDGDVWQSKLVIGRAVRSGASVAPPTGCEDEVHAVTTPLAAGLDAFWEAGYQYCDAEALAASLGVDDPFEAKAAIGAALLAGDDAPTPTGCTS